MKDKKTLFTDIIGYDEVKRTLCRLIDVLNNQNKYKKLGCTIPRGLLLYGDPGLGKTSIANGIIDNVDRKSFIVRKTKSDGEFINYLNNIFKQAKEAQPSLILLDDLDKYADKNGSEEYVTVQSLIDNVEREDVFIIATVNEKNKLPQSLLRSGRFDVQLYIDKPNEQDSYKIVDYYLNSKKIDVDVDIQNIACILNGASCADLEKVCNIAGIYAGYKNAEKIGMNELLRASLEFKYDANIEDLNKEDKYAFNVAYHEAGHALIGELIEPGSVSFVTTAKCESNIRGMTLFHNNDNYFDDIRFMENRIKTLLAGKAATEIVYHTCDVGSNNDLNRAFEIARRLIDNYCMLDFGSWFTSYETSEKVKESKDSKTNKLLTDYYNEVKEMLIANRHKLDLLAKKLKDKKFLFRDEIEAVCKCK